MARFLVYFEHIIARQQQRQRVRVDKESEKALLWIRVGQGERERTQRSAWNLSQSKELVESSSRDVVPVAAHDNGWVCLVREKSLRGQGLGFRV